MGPGEALEAYLFFLRHERGLAGRTIRAAASVQRSWEQSLRENSFGRTWLEATPQDLGSFLQARHHLADTTIGVVRWHLKSLYAWLQREGLALANLSLNLATQARSPRQRSPWFVPSYEQLQRMMELPDTLTLEGIRDRVILELLYATGVRSQELLSMRVHTVWPSERRAAVVGKGNKERLVVMSESAAEWLAYYLKVVHPRLLRRRRLAAIPTKGDQCVFPSTRAPAALSYGTLRLRVKEYAVRANMPLLTAHTLRRAFATHLYQGGADLRTIQILLGHAHLVTTTLYTQVPSPRLHEMIERHHPRGCLYTPSFQHALSVPSSDVAPSYQNLELLPL